MIPNCHGCEEDWRFACTFIARGCHIATAKGREFQAKRHLHIMIVDDKGKLVVW